MENMKFVNELDIGGLGFFCVRFVNDEIRVERILYSNKYEISVSIGYY